MNGTNEACAPVERSTKNTKIAFDTTKDLDAALAVTESISNITTLHHKSNTGELLEVELAGGLTEKGYPTIEVIAGGSQISIPVADVPALIRMLGSIQEDTKQFALCRITDKEVRRDWEDKWSSIYDENQRTVSNVD